ncbi:MAG: DUF4294 domain-containing protein [Saprospiraceae bacterium]|nr:DUF4294 domain-containing protein [Saprospiraceae bacterium]MDW8484308.1 DUF4294 domain-containing protein [Saprospiraceae bacterium]
MPNRLIFFLLITLSTTSAAEAQWLAEDPWQATEETPSVAPRGAWARLEIINGDSIFVMALPLVKISARRIFKDDAERRQHFLYTRAARKVYPYALQAIRLYEELQAETQDMNKRQRRRYYRREKRNIEKDYEEQIKSLTVTEGKVLIKMIEKELKKPFYELIKETRGGLAAAYWHKLGKLWGYDLKNPYIPGADPLLDEVLLDYDFGKPSW